MLVRGETGTGKEFVAELLHAQSSRSKGPLVRFNCAALPADLADALNQLATALDASENRQREFLLSMARAEDRERFQQMLHELKLLQPPNRTIAEPELFAFFDAVMAEMVNIDNSMSTYKPESEVSRVNANAAKAPIRPTSSAGQPIWSMWSRQVACRKRSMFGASRRA